MGEQVSERESLAAAIHPATCSMPGVCTLPFGNQDLHAADAALAWFAAHQPARVAPSEQDREALALGLWDDGIIRPEWLARQAVDHICDDPILSSQPTVEQVREQTLREAADDVDQRVLHGYPFSWASFAAWLRDRIARTETKVENPGLLAEEVARERVLVETITWAAGKRDGRIIAPLTLRSDQEPAWRDGYHAAMQAVVNHCQVERYNARTETKGGE